MVQKKKTPIDNLQVIGEDDEDADSDEDAWGGAPGPTMEQMADMENLNE